MTLDAHSMKTNLAWALCAYFMQATTTALDAASDDEYLDAFLNYNQAGSAWCEAEDHILGHTDPLFEALEMNPYDNTYEEEEEEEAWENRQPYEEVIH